MTLESFAQLHNLPNEWLILRHECEGIVQDPQFWYRSELQTAARALAVRASDILQEAIRTSSGSARKERHQPAKS